MSFPEFAFSPSNLSLSSSKVDVSETNDKIPSYEVLYASNFFCSYAIEKHQSWDGHRDYAVLPAKHMNQFISKFEEVVAENKVLSSKNLIRIFSQGDNSIQEVDSVEAVFDLREDILRKLEM